MRYIFIATGGSGSSYLVKCLNSRYHIDSKPDTYFVLKGQPFTKKKKNFHQIIGDKGIETFPEKQAVVGFVGRTDFQMDENKTIAYNMENYIDVVKKDPNRTAIFNALSKFNFFVEYNISDLVCLVRHPMHAYLSFTKKERHFNLVENTGGVNSKKSIDYYTDAWNRNVKQYLLLVDNGSVCLRYEFMKEDILKTSMSKELFSGWDSSNRNNGLTSENEKYLMSKVEDNYFKIYDNWEV